MLSCSVVHDESMLAEDSALRSAVHSARGALSGEARLGVIPSATTWATGIVERAVAAHPDLRIALRLGLSSEDIMMAIRHYELDAGLVHPSAGDEHDMQLTPLGSELFVLVTSVRAARPAGSTITAREVVDRPLCLFDPLLRARMLLDDACAGVGVVLRPVVETNSVEGLIAVARSGVADAVVPASTVAEPEGWPDLRVAAINDPEIRLPIALARLADEPRPPVVAAIEALVGGR